MPFDDIHLLKSERRSLLSFLFRKKKRRENIECFESLYETYHFIKANHYADKFDGFNSPIPDGTYSLSTEYQRYRVYLREKRIRELPNWVAIVISLLSLVINAILALL